MAVATPIFHIGFHKTATTWFQNRVYPAVTNATMVPTERVRDVFLLPRAFDFDVAAARRELAAAGDRPIVCHEELSGNIHSGGLHGCLSKEIAYRLHAVGPDGRVVIFLRNQVEMVASAYGQYVRVGGTYGLDRYLRPDSDRPHRAPLFDLGHFDYRLLVEHYVGLFGRERVSIQLFEELRSDNRAFLVRYLAEHGLEADLDAIDYRPEHPGYGAGTLRLARLVNVFSRDQIPYKYWLFHVPGLQRRSIRLLERLNGSPAAGRRRPAREFLGPRHVQVIEARFGESNRKLASEFGLPLAEHGYPMAR